MKTCLCCLNTTSSDVSTCALCGEGSWASDTTSVLGEQPAARPVRKRAPKRGPELTDEPTSEGES